MELQARSAPPDWSKDCGIARRCKLFLGTELGRGARVLGDLFVWPPIERRRESAAPNLQAESYLEQEHNARWAALTGSSVGFVPTNLLVYIQCRLVGGYPETLVLYRRRVFTKA